VKRSRRPARAAKGDEGQTTLLLLGYTLIALSLILTAASATSVHLARHRLLAVADAAALDAADAVDRYRFYAELGGAGPGPDQVVALTTESVRSSVVAYLAAAPDPSGIAGVTVAEPTGSPDGFTAQVTLTTVARLPFLGTVLGDRAAVPVTVTARARAAEAG
jgi:hypothetical protein